MSPPLQELLHKWKSDEQAKPHSVDTSSAERIGQGQGPEAYASRPTLREVLNLWNLEGQVIQPVTLAESKAITAVKKLVDGETIKPPQPADLDSLRKKLQKASNTQDYSSLTPIDWRYSPFALEGAEGLLESPNLLRRYLGELTSRARPRILKGLAAIYVKTFSVKSESTKALGAFLADRVMGMGPTWKKAQENFALFQHDNVVDRLAELLASRGSTSQGIADVYQAVGLPSSLLSSQLSLQALRTALAKITRNHSWLAEEQQVKTIIALTSDGHGGLAWERGSALVETMTDALLLPFRNASPRPEVRGMIEGHLLRQLKDPRLHSADWLGTRSEAMAIIKRWLTEQSLELFLDIVDKVVNKSEDAKRMWRLRGSFWRSYLQNRYIDEAWVVLGKDGEQHARAINVFNASTGQNVLCYGKLSSSTDITKHIVLMMKIDSLTIVDWSHNGKCHIWAGATPNAPKLYNLSYTRDQLVYQSERSFTHTASGTWRYEVADIIDRYTQRRVTIY